MLLTICISSYNFFTKEESIRNKSISMESSDGHTVRAFTSGAVDVGLITSQVKPMTSLLVLIASLLDN